MRRVIFAVCSVVVVSALSGCAVPAILGVKSYQSGDTKIEFITGVDFGFGMNGVDTVNNNRGISTDGGARRGSSDAKENGRY